nr:histidine kinase [uncultured Friedmanniella sp.]
MRRPTPFELTLVVAAASVTGLLVLRDPAAGPAEWVFGTFLFLLAGYVVRTGVVATLRALAERTRARRLEATRPEEVARAAIHEERRRLGEDIGAALRRTMADVVAEIEVLDAADPVPGLRRIHQRTQLATSELRRHLGLLRSPVPAEKHGPASTGPRTARSRDLALASGLVVLALLEVTAYLATEGPLEWLPWSPVLTALAAACVAGRTAAPGAASALCGAVFLVGWLVGYPVTGGFWAFGTLGCLVWAVAAHASVISRDLLGGLLLVTAVIWTRQADDGDNLLITVVMISVAASGGLILRMARGGETRARGVAATREAALVTATREAISAERIGFARDLHDVVSHAVGLIALQSSAAQVSWPHDPAAMRRSVAVIDATARSTLEELDRLGLPVDGEAAGVEGLFALAGRIRAAGTPVDLTVVGALPATCGAVVHRVLQESLTNAVRHAPGASVRAAVSSDEHQVVVRVSDGGAGPGSGVARGYGLVGLTERVSLAGGTLTAGPGTDGGFVVEAVLPLNRAVMSP